MSNEQSPKETIVALYSEIQRLEQEITTNNKFIWDLQVHNNQLIEGFKQWAYHMPECISETTKLHEDCTCGLAEFAEQMDIH